MESKILGLPIIAILFILTIVFLVVTPMVLLHRTVMSELGDVRQEQGLYYQSLNDTLTAEEASVSATPEPEITITSTPKPVVTVAPTTEPEE